MGKPSNISAEERARTVVAVLRNEVTAVEAARRHGVSEQSIHHWKAAFLEGGQERLAGRRRPTTSDREAGLRATIDELTRALTDANVRLRALDQGATMLPPSQTSR